MIWVFIFGVSSVIIICLLVGIIYITLKSKHSEKMYMKYCLTCQTPYLKKAKHCPQCQHEKSHTLVNWLKDRLNV